MTIWSDELLAFDEYRSLEVVERGAIQFKSSVNSPQLRVEPNLEADYETEVVVRNGTTAWLAETFEECEDLDSREYWKSCGSPNVRTIRWYVDLDNGGQMEYLSLSDPTRHRLDVVLRRISGLREVT